MGKPRPEVLAEEERTHSIIGAFYEVYNSFGNGFSESVYLAALECELILRGHKVAREVSICVQSSIGFTVPSPHGRRQTNNRVEQGGL